MTATNSATATATLSTTLNFKIMELISYLKSKATRTRVVFYTVGMLISIGFWAFLFGANDKSLKSPFVFNSLWPGLLGFICLFSLGTFVDRSVFTNDSGDIFSSGDSSQSAKKMTTMLFLTLSMVSVAISFVFEASLENPVRTGVIIQTTSFCLASLIMFFGRELDQSYF